MPKLSVVITVYNEEENIPLLIAELEKSLSDLDYEVVYVDDGSRDNTVKEIRKCTNQRIKLVELQRNYGQSTALAAGIDTATGDFIATIDGDLQNDPADIPQMLKLAEEEEWDLVAGERKNRKDGFIMRRLPSLIANSIIRNTTKVKFRDYGCTLRVMQSWVAKDLGLYGELHRFIPVLASLKGARMTQVEVNHRPRKFGHSKYGMGRTFRVMSDLLLMIFFKRYMQKPMHLFGTLGIFLFIGGLGIDIYLLVLKIMGEHIWGKPLLLLGILMTLAGIQIITVGIMSELQMRTYYESQNKKTYRIKKISIGGKNA